MRTSGPLILALLFASGVTAAASPARAQLIVCNKTRTTIWFATGRRLPTGNISSGWFKFRSGYCGPVMSLLPDDRTVYGYMNLRPGLAAGEPSRDPLFCMNWRPFKDVVAGPNCPHGFETEAFFPIPTAGRRQYTLTVGSRLIDVPLVNPPPPDPAAP